MIIEFNNSQRDELLRFLSKWCPDHPELGEGDIFDWQKCYRYVYVDQGEIIGYMAQIPQSFWYGRHLRWKVREQLGWGVTLVLNMSYSDRPERKRSTIVNAFLDRLSGNHCSYAGVGVVPAIEKLYLNRGLRIRRDCVRMYVRFLNIPKMLKYSYKSVMYLPLIKIANVVFPMDKKWRYGRLDWVEQFSESMDNDWDRLLSERYDLYGARDAYFLNYKLGQPNREYHAYIHSDGGYIIFRSARRRVGDLHIIKVCDLVGSDAVRLDLLTMAMELAKNSKAYGIVALGSVVDQSVYRKAGLYISKAYPVVLPASVTENIHISFFDSDLDNLW